MPPKQRRAEHQNRKRDAAPISPDDTARWGKAKRANDKKDTPPFDNDTMSIETPDATNESIPMISTTYV